MPAGQCCRGQRPGWRWECSAKLTAVQQNLTRVQCFAAGLLAPLAAGGTVIIPAGGKFSAGTFWRDATEHGATYYTAVPTMHQVSHACVR